VDKLTKEQFLKHLRGGLNHLHDPSYLRRSPLATLFGVANQFDTPSAIRQILTEAIEALEPEADEPPESRTWRIYEAVYYRYVEQFSQEDVADELGISVRQLRREQRAAFESLVYQLRERFDLQGRQQEDADPKIATRLAEASLALNEELLWLKDAPPETPTDLGQTLPEVVSLVQPLTAQYGVNLELKGEDTVPPIAVDPVASRQILLNLLGVAIPQAPVGGKVHIAAEALPWEVEVSIRVEHRAEEKPPPFAINAVSDDEKARLDMARQLSDLCGARLTLSDAPQAFSSLLTLPALEQCPVLVIDDNVGTLQLLQRYTAGTRYRLIGTRKPEQAVSLAQKSSPQIIVLDVMMPHVDGWEILGRLRQHPLTSDIPVIVCTILAQEELALSLGASDFVRKPVTRQNFLAALDQQIGRMARVSH
jgi:CheY-like chemotaxis protein/AraC-like DNA-binding protein